MDRWRHERERENKQKVRNTGLLRRIVWLKKTLQQKRVEYGKEIKELALERKKEGQVGKLKRQLMKKFRRALEEERETAKKNQNERRRLRDQKERRHREEEVLVSLAKQISFEKRFLKAMNTKVAGQSRKAANFGHKEKQAEGALKKLVLKQTHSSRKLRNALQLRGKLIVRLGHEKFRLLQTRRLYVKSLHAWHLNQKKLGKLKAIVSMLSHRVRQADQKYEKELGKEKSWEAKERANAAIKKNRLLHELRKEKAKIVRLRKKIKTANQKHLTWTHEREKQEALQRKNFRAMKMLEKQLEEATRRNSDMKRALSRGHCSAYEKWHEIRRKEENLVRTLLGKREEVSQMYGKVRKARKEIRKLIQRLRRETANRRRKDFSEKLSLARKEQAMFKLKTRLRAQRKAELATSKYLTERGTDLLL